MLQQTDGQTQSCVFGTVLCICIPVAKAEPRSLFMEKCKILAILSLFANAQVHTFAWDYSVVDGCNKN